MKTHMLFPAIIFLIFSACGHSGPWNELIKITNSTDRTISVYYEIEKESESLSSDTEDDEKTIITVYKKTRIASNKSASIDMKSDYQGKADFTIVYGGIACTFNNKSDAKIVRNHFVNIVNGGQ